MKLPQTLIISGFPLVGKSWLFQHQNKLGLKVADSDSSLYSWVYDGNGNKTTQRHPDFPNNYMADIKAAIEARELDIIMVSSHAQVRQALLDNGINFVMAYPDTGEDAKQKGLYKYDHREKNGFTREFLESNYESMVQEGIDFANMTGVKLYTIQNNLSDTLDDIILDLFGEDIRDFVFKVEMNY